MTLEKALALTEIGMFVFPVREAGGPGEIKTPYTYSGFKDATQSRRQLEEWWSDWPAAWVGVATGMSGINVGDIDEHDGKVDGRETLRDNGIDSLTTFSYGTLSGHGRHYIYEGPDVGPGKPFGPNMGVDRQSGGSYIVWYGPVPSSRAVFEPAPAWLLENPTRKIEGATPVDIDFFLAEVDDLEPDREMKAAIDRIPDGDFGRNDLYRRALEIAMLHFEGSPGVKTALLALKSEWLREPYGTAKYRKELRTTVANALGRAKRDAVVLPSGARREELLARMKGGPAPKPKAPTPDDDDTVRVVSWGELQNTAYDVEWLIEGLMPSNGLGLITGHSGIGKTTLALGLAATLATGGDEFLAWKIPAPRPRKVLFLSLELDAWQAQQFQAPLGERYDRGQLAQNLYTYPLGQPMMLNLPTAQAEVIAMLEEHRPSVLLIDSLGETLRDLQNEKESGELFDFFKAINSTGVSIFVIHHHRKVNQENAGRNRRLNSMADVFGSYNVTKQPQVIIDIDEQRVFKDGGHTTEVIENSFAVNLLKARFTKKLDAPLALERADDGHFLLDTSRADIVASTEERPTHGFLNLPV